MHRAIGIGFVLFLAGCGSSGSAPADVTPGDHSTAACTGPAPLHATPCPAIEAPATDTPRYVTPACSRRPCSHACVSGYVVSGGSCVAGTPAPRASAVLRDAGDGTLVDEDSGARWLKQPGCSETVLGVERPGGSAAFLETGEWVSRLGSGSCGLADGSRPGDWHIPSETELLGLVDVASLFSGALAGPAWSSMEPCSTTAITVDPTTGEVGEHLKGDLLMTWPIRRP